jgi:hypothetical protein
MNHLRAVNTSCQESVWNAGLYLLDILRVNWRGSNKTPSGQTYTANNQWTEKSSNSSRNSTGFKSSTNFLNTRNLLNLLVPLLMTVLSQSFFTLVRRNFMTLPFFTTRHTQIIFLILFINKFKTVRLSQTIITFV